MTPQPVRVAILDDYQDVARSLAPWSQSALDIDLVTHHQPIGDDDELVRRLQGCHVVVLMRERTALSRRVVERLPELRLLVTTGMHNAAIDPEIGLTLCGTESSPVSPAELTWGLITALRRHLITESQGLREGRWQRTLGENLEGSILGVAGLGRIGGRVAAIGRAFGMRVLAWSQNLAPDAAVAHGVEAVSKDTLLRRADVLSLHLRLSARTHHVIGANELAMMKPDAVLVNTARAALVDTEALCVALHAGRLGGAGLDVYDTEPLPPGHPLLSAPRTVLTPHLGYVTRQNYATYFTQALEDIERFFAGDPVRVVRSGAPATGDAATPDG